MKILFAVSAFIAVATFVNGQCTTPSGGQGDCVVISKCQELLQLINKPNRTPQDIDTLRKSSCGFEGSNPMVCCPKAVSNTNDVACYTPNRKQGKCVNIYSCPHLAAMLKPPVPKESLQFVQKSRCQGTDLYSVCCGPPIELKPVPNRNSCANSLSAIPPDPASRCCGYDNTGEDRIVGGNYTTIDQYPWLTLIEYQGTRDNRIKLLCGGSLISARYVLTAAHCLAGPVLDIGRPKNVRLGEYDTENAGPDCDFAPGSVGAVDCAAPIVVIPIEKTIPHPQYEVPVRKRNDIGLIRLTENAPYTDFIRPICLPSLPDITINQPKNFKFWVAGWGAINSTHSKSNIKLHVQLPFVGQRECQPPYTKRKTELSTGQMCAGGEKGKDSCRGDSGGPLMYEVPDGPFEIIGVVSFGPTPCGMEDIPGVYTKVVEYLDWINQNITP